MIQSCDGLPRSRDCGVSRKRRPVTWSRDFGFYRSHDFKRTGHLFENGTKALARAPNTCNANDYVIYGCLDIFPFINTSRRYNPNVPSHDR